MTGPTPILDAIKRGEVAPDVRLLAAQGGLPTRAIEQLSILVLLTGDPEPQIHAAADDTLNRIPAATLSAFLANPDVPDELREFLAARGVTPDATASADPDKPLIETEAGDSGGEAKDDDPQTVAQQLAKMSFSDRLKAAVKGSREMRNILIRDSNKMIAAAVLSSPKLTEQEVEGYARMTNLSEDILRIIGTARAWTKNYMTVLALTKNAKTPLAISLNLLPRLNGRDMQVLSIDRNVPEPLRIAARKKVVDLSKR